MAGREFQFRGKASSDWPGPAAVRGPPLALRSDPPPPPQIKEGTVRGIRAPAEDYPKRLIRRPLALTLRGQPDATPADVGRGHLERPSLVQGGSRRHRGR